MALHVAMLATIYSGSAELSATNFCFLLHQDIIPNPTLNQYPKVLFRSIELPGQSASVNQFKLMSSPWEYFNPYPTCKDYTESNNDCKDSKRFLKIIMNL